MDACVGSQLCLHGLELKVGCTCRHISKHGGTWTCTRG